MNDGPLWRGKNDTLTPIINTPSSNLTLCSTFTYMYRLAGASQPGKHVDQNMARMLINGAFNVVIIVWFVRWNVA